jgi:hypothetical protein
MKRILCKTEDLLPDMQLCVNFKHLTDYFHHPARLEDNGIISLYDNSNYYTPVLVRRCYQGDADLHFTDNKGTHFYYEYVER